MLENFIFENHLGLTFNGLENGVYLNYNDLRDYKWDFDTINGRISRFYKGVTHRKLPLVVSCDSPEEAAVVLNRIHELAEADIEAKKPGRVYIGEYYTVGYITGSVKTDYLEADRVCKLDLTLTCENSAWYKERTEVFAKNSGESMDSESGLDYPYDYPFDYALLAQDRVITLDSKGSSNFRLKIYGEAVNPSITIGGHTYAINGTVGNGATLLIDSLAKTITLTTAAGTTVNWFDKRDRWRYIFKPIPTGRHKIIWDGSFGFDLTYIEKRSEPKWT